MAHNVKRVALARAKENPAMLNKTIAHYTILEKLGEGGMGVVYKATDTKLKRDVAIKFLPREIAVGKEERERFEVEAQAAAALNHPNIATIYAIEEADGEAFIVMEYIDGKELKKKINDGVTLDDALDITQRVVTGLGAAHQKGIVHRDIKSSNIMVTKNGDVKIMDFGLAKVRGSGLLTKTNMIMGTVAYMSPEQASGDSVDHRTDIWSLGVVLYEMLTGELPFKVEHDAAWAQAIINQEPLKPSALDRKIPPQVDAIVMKMLAKNRDERYESADVVMTDLKEVQEELKRSERGAKTKAIAVVPFNNISPDQDSDYFSDWLTEELIMNLSRLKDMRVVSRTTSMQYKDTKKGIKMIGRELGVRYLVEGSVRKFQDNLRITAQLVDVESDAQLWAESFRGNLADVFDIQEEVSKQIVDALMLKLTPAEKVVLEKRATLDPEAFDCHLRARDFLYRTTKKSIQFAIQLFERAIEYDPRYASAHAGLGEAYALLYGNFERKSLWLDKAMEAGLKALMYDSNSPEAYTALGLAHYYKKSFDDAITAGQKAIELDPNSFVGHWVLGRILHMTDRDDEAVSLFEKTIELNPDFYTAYLDLRMAYERLGNEKKYQEVLKTSLQLYPRYLTQHPDDARARMLFAQDLAQAGKASKAKEEAAKAIDLDPADALMLYNAACFYSRVGENAVAVDSLRNAIAAGYVDYDYIRRDPDLDSIRKDSGYVELLDGK
jgi:serine/threonine protein kinase/Flp pilus assembly protein TadD